MTRSNEHRSCDGLTIAWVGVIRSIKAFPIMKTLARDSEYPEDLDDPRCRGRLEKIG